MSQIEIQKLHIVITVSVDIMRIGGCINGTTPNYSFIQYCIVYNTWSK